MRIMKKCENKHGLFAKVMKGKRLLLKERARVRELHRAGKSIASLAEEFKLHWSTIYRIVKEGNKKKKKRGPQKLLVGRWRHKLLTAFRENPTISASKAAKIIGLSVSPRTIRRELRNSAFTYVWKKKVQYLTEKHKEKRLDFARKNVT